MKNAFIVQNVSIRPNVCFNTDIQNRWEPVTRKYLKLTEDQISQVIGKILTTTRLNYRSSRMSRILILNTLERTRH